MKSKTYIDVLSTGTEFVVGSCSEIHCNSLRLKEQLWDCFGVETCYRKITTVNLFWWKDLDVHFTLKLVNCFSFERPLFGSVLGQLVHLHLS